MLFPLITLQAAILRISAIYFFAFSWILVCMVISPLLAYKRLSVEGRKREFLSDPKYLAYKGFAVADTSECGINLMYLPLAQDA